MDSRFKKMNIKFSVFSKLKKIEDLKKARICSRNEKQLAARNVGQEDNSDEESAQSGLSKSRIPAREELLKKFKEEKNYKRKVDLMSKKAPFVVPISLAIPAVLPDIEKALKFGKGFKDLESTSSAFDFSRAATTLSSGTQFKFQASIPSSLIPRQTSSKTSVSSPISVPDKSGTSKSVSFADPEVIQKPFAKTYNTCSTKASSSTSKLSTVQIKKNPKTTYSTKASSSTSKLSTVQIKKSTKTSLGQELTKGSSKSTSEFAGQSANITLKPAMQTSKPANPRQIKLSAHPSRSTSKSVTAQQTVKAVAFGRCVTVNSSKLLALQKPKPELTQKEIKKSVVKPFAPQKIKQEPVLKGILKPASFSKLGRSKTKTAPKPVTYTHKIQKKRRSDSAAQFTQNLTGTDEDSSPPAQSRSIFICDVSKIESVDASIKKFEPKSLASIACSLISYNYRYNIESPPRKTRTSTPIKNDKDNNKDTGIEDSSSISSAPWEKQDLVALGDCFKNVTISEAEKQEIVSDKTIEIEDSSSISSAPWEKQDLVVLGDCFKNVTISEAKKQEIVSDKYKSNLIGTTAKEVEPPKCVSKSLLRQVLQPRRSSRIKDKLRLSNSCENLLDVSRPSIMGLADLDSPGSDSTYKFGTARSLSYQFEFSKSGKEEAEIPESLLYSPPQTGPSVEGDLITFSPMQ